MTTARLVRTVDWRFKSILVIETGLLMIILDLIDAVRKLGFSSRRRPTSPIHGVVTTSRRNIVTPTKAGVQSLLQQLYVPVLLLTNGKAYICQLLAQRSMYYWFM